LKLKHKLKILNKDKNIS